MVKNLPCNAQGDSWIHGHGLRSHKPHNVTKKNPKTHIYIYIYIERERERERVIIKVDSANITEILKHKALKININFKI